VKNVCFYETKCFTFLSTNITATQLQQRCYVQNETEEGFVPKQQSSNQRLLATGLKLVNLLLSESFCNITTKYFFLFQKKGKSYKELA
jgi:hypothetical protein